MLPRRLWEKLLIMIMRHNTHGLFFLFFANFWKISIKIRKYLCTLPDLQLIFIQLIFIQYAFIQYVFIHHVLDASFLNIVLFDQSQRLELTFFHLNDYKRQAHHRAPSIKLNRG
jgi:hypothetical protein